MSYKIVCDSCTDVTEEMKETISLYMVPLTIEVGEFEIIDDETFDQKDFLKKVSEYPECPKSSCPPPEAYMQYYGGEEDIYVVTLSSNLSGSYNSAELARKLYLEENPEKNILVIDSFSASVGQTLLMLKIKELAESGKDFAQIKEELLRYREEQNTKFVLESLETLRKNGRLSNLKAILCNTLNIKPVMTATPSGTIEKVGQARGMNKALQKMAEAAAKDAVKPEERILGIAHCNNIERALFTKEKIMELIPFKEVIIVETAGISSLYANNGGIIIAY